MDHARVAELLAEGCATYAVPGAQVGLLRGAERLVVCHGVTSIDASTPIDHTTSFHAGSLTKSLAALVVVDAARRGELELDVPCNAQVPGLWDDTPRALMAHTSGRPNLLPEPDESADSFIERVADLPRVHLPGRFSYCNAGWTVLDVLLGHRAGAGFEELAAARVLGDSATFGRPEHSAAGHGARPGEPVRTVTDQYAAAASAAGARWWTTADQLLDYARLHLDDGGVRLDARDVQELRRPHVEVPGATVSDAWGLGWALWDRADHRAFGWAGYTGGHRAYLRCFPAQDAALVVLANCAGPLFGPPGGSALFDALLPDLLRLLGVPPLSAPHRPPGDDVATLAGHFGPLTLTRAPADTMVLDAAALGEPTPLVLHRVGGNSFVASHTGGMTVAVDGDFLYLGPFVVPRSA